MADSVGYTDTSVIPGSNWRVHDGDRPQPRVVTPGGAIGNPPSDAVVLFDGSDLAQWIGRDGGDAAWKVENGYMEVNGTGDISTRAHFGDCQLHLEWATPEEVVGDSQGRGNSGVFLLGLYEIQVLDSFDNRTYADGSASSIYGQYPPLVNACRGPGEWQSYDVIFESPSWGRRQAGQRRAPDGHPQRDRGAPPPAGRRSHRAPGPGELPHAPRRHGPPATAGSRRSGPVPQYLDETPYRLRRILRRHRQV